MPQTRFWMILTGCLLSSSLVFAAPPKPTARADLRNAAGETIGTATFVQAGKKVRINVSVSKLTPGEHGIHVHETGKCEAPDFKSAGGHFNPTHKEHGLKNPSGPHAGDLANLEVNDDGTAKAIFITSQVTLAPGPESLLKEGGTALVIHGAADDQKSNPAGNSGSRVACGVIELAK